MEVSSSNEQDKDYLHVEFLRNSLLDNNEQESDNESINEIQTEENIRGRDNASRSHGRGHDRGHGHGHGRGHDHGHNNSNNNQNTIELSPPPFFNTFQHTKPLHNFTINLSRDYLPSLSPYSIFSLFFSLEQIEIIIKNTNIYTYSKNAEEGRKWKDLTIGEFRIWLAILKYAGIFKLPSIKDYWNRDNKLPEHNIITFMTLLRFEQVLLI